MLEKVSAINYQRCYPKRLKKFFQSDVNYKSYLDLVHNLQGSVLGNIPSEIVELIEPQMREEKIKALLSVFSETAKACREQKNLDEMRAVLYDGLKEVLPQGTNAELDYIGCGGYKNVYRFGLRNKNGDKIMHDKALLFYFMNNAVYAKKSHGVYAEPNSWYYLQKNIGHSMDRTQFTKHYISDVKNGYTMTEFIDDDISKTTKDFEHNRVASLILTDSQNNPRKQNKVYDIGGMQRYQDALKDRLTIKYFKKIANRNTQKERETVVNQLSEKAKNPRTPHRSKIIEALNYYYGLPTWFFDRTSEKIPIKMIW